MLNLSLIVSQDTESLPLWLCKCYEHPMNAELAGT